MFCRAHAQCAARSMLPLLVLLTVVPAPSLLGQSSRFEGEAIREVEFRGLRSFSEETLLHYLFGSGSTSGLPLELKELNRRLHGLWDRELVDDIKIAVEAVPGGVKLIIDVIERPLLTSVEYSGLKKVSRSDIVERIDRDRLSVYEGQPLDRGEISRLQGVIEELYREKGYRFANVSYTLEASDTGQIRAIFTVDEGDRVKIGDIDFDGNTVFSDLRLRFAMKKTKQSGLISNISKKSIYNPAHLGEDLETIRNLYRKSGYKDVAIAGPEIGVEAKRPNAPTPSQQKRRLTITIPIEEGERWQLGDLTIEGNEVFSDEVLLRQFEKPNGGWLRSKVVDDGVEKVSKLYQSVGYVFSEVNTEVQERQENVADVVVHVAENDQYRVGRMEFEGNSKTRDKVLRREMLVQEAMVMNMNALESSLLKIRQLNYFALNEEEPLEFDFDADTKTVDLVVQGEEADRTELQFGGGFSELDGFFGQFAMRTRNFLGRGETLGVQFQSGRQRDVFNIDYGIPWFLDRPQNLGVQVFSQTFDSRVLTGVDFQQKFKGGSFTYGRRLAAFQTLSLTYSFADIEDIRSIVGLDGETLTQAVDFTSSSIRPSWLFNTVDSRFEPTRGRRMTASLELAGSILGGETEFIRPTLGFVWFKPASRRPWRSSFGFQATAGLIEPIADSVLFPQQRFFLGGENSVRGFRRRSIVVRDDDGNIVVDASGFPLGGDRMLELNVEYHVIMGGPFRVVFFADAGGVFQRDQSIDPGLMRYSAGAELRILVPLFGAPLRFIWANNLDERPNDQFESFDFTVNTSF